MRDVRRKTMQWDRLWRDFEKVYVRLFKGVVRMKKMDVIKDTELIFEIINKELLSSWFLKDDFTRVVDAYLSVSGSDYTISLLFNDKIYFGSNSNLELLNHVKVIKECGINKINGKYESLELLTPYLAISSDVLSYLQIYQNRKVLWCENDDIFKVLNIQDCKAIRDVFMQVDEYKNNVLDMQTFLERELENIKNERQITYCLKDSKSYVSCATISSINNNSCILGGVATVPMYRGMGYSTKVVSKLCYDISQTGKSIYLFFNNPAAGSVYRKVGFVDVDKWRIMII